MTFLPRLLVVALAAYAVASLCGSAALIVSWRRIASAGAADAARLFRWRLVPVAAAGAFSLSASAAFERFEPRAGVERTGFLLVWLAVLAAAILGVAIVKFLAGHAVTRRALRAWMASAESTILPDVPVPALVVDSAFPIVAVVGVLRPRLIVARSVVRACTPDEWRAIVAHEAWHLRRRDNARRALLAAMPDALAWLAFSSRAAQQWSDAAEYAADSAAARGWPAARLSLASALVRVARLAPPNPAPAVIPVTALYRGENLEARLRRILDGAHAPCAVRSPARLLISGALLMGGCLLALHPIHELVESAVSYLP